MVNRSGGSRRVSRPLYSKSTPSLTAATASTAATAATTATTGNQLDLRRREGGPLEIAFCFDVITDLKIGKRPEILKTGSRA